MLGIWAKVLGGYGFKVLSGYFLCHMTIGNCIWPFVIGYGFYLLIIHHWLWLLVIGYWLLGICHWLWFLAIDYLPLTMVSSY
jgi:drug/metabolite transporter (DMT)-like permease